MKMQYQRGYAGMIGLMIGTLIMAILFARVYLTPKEQPSELRAMQPLSASGTVPTTEIEQMHADVDAANKTRELLNEQNRATNAALGE